MNPWSVDFCYLLLFIILLIIGIISVIMIIKNKHKQVSVRSSVVSLVTSSVLFSMLTVFVASHSTYYKFNDWTIVGSNISMVQQKYGDFDLGAVTDNKAGKVAYYTYTDNGPIMPDHLKHYYYIEYDESGLINKVYDACQPGG